MNLELRRSSSHGDAHADWLGLERRRKGFCRLAERIRERLDRDWFLSFEMGYMNNKLIFVSNLIGLQIRIVRIRIFFFFFLLHV